MCKMSAANFSALVPAFESMGIKLVGVGMEKLGYEEFIEGGYWRGPIPLLIDEKKESYTALSCVKNSWRNLWGFFDDMKRVLKIAEKKGFENKLKGDIGQNGGTFVIGPKDGALLYGHYQTSKVFAPSMVDLLESLKIPVPDDYDPYAAEGPLVLKKRTASQADPKAP